MRATIQSTLDAARAENREQLTELEALAVIRELGIEAPVHRLVAGAREAAEIDLGAFPSERLVVKVVSSEIVHKSDAGGVVTVARDRAAMVAAVAAMERRFAGHEVAGYGLFEHVAHDASLGGELLLGLRYTPDFGPVLSFGPGGIYAEHLAAHLRPDAGVAILSPSLHGPGGGAAPLALALAGKAVTQPVTSGLRGRHALLPAGQLEGLLQDLLDFAATAMPGQVAELEINPLVIRDGRPVALDALLRLGGTIGRGAEPAPSAPRPLDKLGRLLRPRSIAVLGVSKRLNPGRVILRNILRAGFDSERLVVVKPGQDAIDGCRCVAGVADLPEPVDLAVLAIDAAQIPDTVDQILTQRKAESLILIPGGLGEGSGSEDRAEKLRRSLAAARDSDWHGPLINGGNCLGVRSLPGRYDTLFIPEAKLPPPPGPPAPLALISQSGAFAIARSSKLPALGPRYLITVGNQIDLTVGDYLTALKDDPEVEVFACYVEGFRPLDGLRFLEAAAEITAGGRPVILYRAGRTPAGARATASHTASIAGDYAATRELARAAGVMLAESLADFEDLVRLFCHLRTKTVAGWRLGAVSNAGFECVAIADSLGRFRLAELADATRARLSPILERGRVASIVGVGNPLDLTPMLADADFAAAVRAVLEDPGVDAGAVGCVPLTGALETLAASAGHGEDLTRPGSVVRRLAALAAELPKAWVAVVDSGPLYDPMAAQLEAARIPTFRTADRALRLFETFCRWRLEAGRQLRGSSPRASSP